MLVEVAKRRLEWVKFRIKMLDRIEVKLKEMRFLAEAAKEPGFSDKERKELGAKINTLEAEVREMDELSRLAEEKETVVC